MTVKVTIHTGDCLAVLRGMEAGSVNCCVTSPPYWGLRDYGADGQIGLEATPEAYVARMVEVFREVRRVLRDDGTLWLNLGDSYAGGASGSNPSSSSKLGSGPGGASQQRDLVDYAIRPRAAGLKTKDLVGIPWRVAFALQADGWYLRQDIIWHKPNPMPESVTDRCTKAHEYIFLMSKSARYYYNADAIKEPITQSSYARLGQDIEPQAGSDRVPGNGPMKAVRFGGNKYDDSEEPETRTKSGKEWLPRMANGAAGIAERKDSDLYISRNKRSVWTVTTQPYKGAHFATFPTKLIEPCILAGCPPGGTVLDPFNGSGTTGYVALANGSRYVGIELNPEYVRLTHDRLEPLTNDLLATLP